MENELEIPEKESWLKQHRSNIMSFILGVAVAYPLMRMTSSGKEKSEGQVDTNDDPSGEFGPPDRENEVERINLLARDLLSGASGSVSRDGYLMGYDKHERPFFGLWATERSSEIEPNFFVYVGLPEGYKLTEATIEVYIYTKMQRWHPVKAVVATNDKGETIIVISQKPVKRDSRMAPDDYADGYERAISEYGVPHWIRDLS